MARTYGDFDTTDVEKAQETTTVYNLLRTELSKPSAAKKEIILRVPARENIKVKYSTEISLDQLDRWRLKSRKNPKREEIDTLQFNYYILSSQCVNLVFNDEDAVDEDGKPLNFQSAAFVDLVGALETNGAIRTFYDRDADILRTASDILEAAGYGDDDDEDPLD